MFVTSGVSSAKRKYVVVGNQRSELFVSLKAEIRLTVIAFMPSAQKINVDSVPTLSESNHDFL